MTISRFETEEHLDAAVGDTRALWLALHAPDVFRMEEDAEALRALASRIEERAAAARRAFEAAGELAPMVAGN